MKALIRFSLVAAVLAANCFAQDYRTVVFDAATKLIKSPTNLLSSNIVASTNISLSVDSLGRLVIASTAVSGGAPGTNDYTGQVVTADAFNRVIKPLGAGTVLTNNQHYWVELTGNRTLTFDGTPADGDEMSLDITNSVLSVLTFPTSVDANGGGVITSATLPPGNHIVFWNRANSAWKFLGPAPQLSFTAAPGISVSTTNVTGTNIVTIGLTSTNAGSVTSIGMSGGTTGFTFTPSTITTSGTFTLSVSSASTARTALGTDDAGNITLGTLDDDRLSANLQALALAGHTGTGAFVRESAAGSGGGLDITATGTSSNATEFTLWSTNVAAGQSITAEVLATGAGPTNSVTAKLIATAFNRTPGGASIRTNPATLSSGTAAADAWFTLSGSDLVLTARGATNENFNWLLKGTTLVQNHGATNAGSGLVALSKTSMIFAWDFDSAADSHSGGHNLSESNSPSYSGGIGHTSLATTSFWETATANLLYNTNSASSFTLAGRVRVNAGASSGRYIFVSHQNRDFLRYNSPSNSARVAQNLTTTLLNAPATNEWLNFVMTYNGTTNRSIWLNGTEYTASEAYAQNVGSLKIGTDSATGAYNIPISFDRFYGWGRVLTTNEIAVLNAATNDNSITYGMLSP